MVADVLVPNMFQAIRNNHADLTLVIVSQESYCVTQISSTAIKQTMFQGGREVGTRRFLCYQRVQLLILLKKITRYAQLPKPIMNYTIHLHEHAALKRRILIKGHYGSGCFQVASPQQFGANVCMISLCSRFADLKPFWVHHALDSNVNLKITHTEPIWIQTICK